jgi:hypothetical protein
LSSWTIDSVLFHSIVRDAWAWQYGCYDAKWDSTEIDPQPRIAQAYTTYLTEAHRNKKLLLQNPRDLEDAWTEVIKSCSNCHTFIFGFVDYMVLNKDLAPDYPSCLCIGSQRHFTGNLQTEVAANVAFKVALQALIKSQTSIREFEIKQPFLDEGVGRSILHGHLRMTIENLKSLRLVHYSKGGRYRNFSDSWLWYEQVTNELKSFTMWCGATLETLFCSGVDVEDGVDWDLDPTPALRTMHFIDSNVTSRSLAALILSSPKLDRLVMENVALVDEGQWQRVFDAVRKHRGAIEVTLDDIDCSNGYRYTLAPFRTRANNTTVEYGAVDAEGNTVLPDDPDWSDVALRKYLDNTGDWDYVLEETFESVEV